MPFIDSKVTLKLSDEDKDSLKSELGKIINKIPGKSENFYGALVEVKLFGSVGEDFLNKVTYDICNLYNEKLNIPQKMIYVKFEEVDNWGWNGSNL